MSAWPHPGVLAALGSALLFGASTPFAKLLLGSVSPWLMAGVLYLGSGLRLAVVRASRRSGRPRLPRAELLWLVAAILFGGVIGPILLMWGLFNMSASGASLLLNTEGVFTAAIAWFVFRENFDRRNALGMLLIAAGALVLAWSGSANFGSIWPALSVLGACLAWGIDNNLTRKVSLADPTFLAMIKGLVAGSVNFVLALAAGAVLPSLPVLLSAAVLGFLSYGPA
jgi:drug/metabolite transporter (DMT)-like permease